MPRSFSLSENVDPKDIYAEFEDSILVVVVPKLESGKPDDTYKIEIT